MSAAPLVGEVSSFSRSWWSSKTGGALGEGRGRASSPDRSSSRGASTRSTWTRSHGEGHALEEGDFALEFARRSGGRCGVVGPSAPRGIRPRPPPPRTPPAPTAWSTPTNRRRRWRPSPLPRARPRALRARRDDPVVPRERAGHPVPRVGAGRRRSRGRLEETVLRERRVAPFSPTWRVSGTRARDDSRVEARANRREARGRADAPVHLSRVSDTRPHRVRDEANARAAARTTFRTEVFGFFGGRIARDISTAQIPRRRARNGHEIGSAPRAIRRRTEPVADGLSSRVVSPGFANPRFGDGRHADVSAALHQ